MRSTIGLLVMATLPAIGTPEGRVVRFATFNASLNRDQPGRLARDLATPDDPQAKNVAEIIQRTAPDVLLINEFDYDPSDKPEDLFRKNYLAVGQHGAPPIDYPHAYVAPVNTGVASGHDLDNDGVINDYPAGRGYGNDAQGFGLFPGQYGMVLYSKFPIDAAKARRFGEVLWKSMPGANLPTKSDGTPWYTDAELAVVRLSSKDHRVLPIDVGGVTVHVLASHPTPPAFDGPEKRNARRNFDEIRLWADYLAGGDRSAYLGSAPPPERFVLMGDQNADPRDGGGLPGAIAQLLDHPQIDASLVPSSDGAAEAAAQQAGANADHRGPAAHDTADFNDRAPGNLRVDYVLPSKGLKPLRGAVFWPKADDPLARLVAMRPRPASSDHRLVWVDARSRARGERPSGPLGQPEDEHVSGDRDAHRDHDRGHRQGKARAGWPGVAGLQPPEIAAVLEARLGQDPDAQADQGDAEPHRQAGARRGGLVVAEGQLAEEDAEPGDHEAEAHQGQAGPHPGEEGALGGQRHPRVVDERVAPRRGRCGRAHRASRRAGMRRCGP